MEKPTKTINYDLLDINSQKPYVPLNSVFKSKFNSEIIFSSPGVPTAQPIKQTIDVQGYDLEEVDSDSDGLEPLLEEDED